MKWLIVYSLTCVAILTVLIRVVQHRSDFNLIVGCSALGLVLIGLLILAAWAIVRAVKNRSQVDLHTT